MASSSKHHEAYIKYVKPYREKHPEKCKEYNAKAYEKHREKIRAWQAEKVRCEVCDMEMSRSSLGTHSKSKSHCEKAGIEFVEMKHRVAAKERVECSCGLTVSRGNLARHLASKRYHPEEKK